MSSWVGELIGAKSPLGRTAANGAFVLACALLVVGALLAADAAYAAPKSLNGFVGGAPGGLGGLFVQPRDVAVYTGLDADPVNDRIFVVSGQDDSNSSVSRLDVDGNFERAWGKDVIAEGPGDTGTGFEICTIAARCQGGDTGSAEGELDDPMGLAVNQSTGHVYVRDRDNRRVQEFDLEGNFVRAWGWGVDTGAAAFQVCSSTCLAGRVDQVEGNANAGQFGGASGPSVGITVHPVTGDVFAADPGTGGTGNRRILQFEADGDFVRGWGFGVDTGVAQFESCTIASTCQAALAQTAAPAGTENGRFANANPTRIAVDADGVVYASDTTDSGRVIRFDSDLSAATALLAPLSAAFLSGSSTTGLEIDPSSGNLLAARRAGPPNDPIVQEITSPGGGSPTIADTHVFDSENPTNEPIVNGIGLNPSNGYIYLGVAPLFTSPNGIFTGCTASSCHGLIVLANATGPVTASAEAATDVGATTAQVGGLVNAGGGHAAYRIEVSRNGISWVDASGQQYVAGSTDVPVSVAISGLEPNTLYRIRLSASKQVGMDEIESVVSAEQIVLTDALAPDVQTRGSAKRTLTGAQLRATVDPNNASTTYRFEYGLAGDSFDKHVPVPDGDAGAGGDPKLVVQTISGLQPDTLYQYRIVAENFVGESVGDVVTFRTKASTPPLPPDGRAYELVSPADEVGGLGAGDWYHSPASHGDVGLAAYDGERFGVQGTWGSMLVDGAYAYATDWALAERTPAGWTHKPAMNRSAFGRQSARFLNMADTNEDFSLMLWDSNGGLLRLFPETEDWSEVVVGNAHYVRDWEGNWEIFGPTDDDQAAGEPLEGSAISADGSLVLATSGLRGLAGPGDPGLDAVVGARNVYLDDVSGGLSNTFPGEGIRGVVNVCTEGTLIPRRLASGKLDAQSCQAPLPGRDARLIDPRGGSIVGDRPVSRTISQDNRRMFFLSPDSSVPSAGSPCTGTDQATLCPSQLYVRQRRGDGSVVTRWISRSEVADQDASLLAAASFEWASPDGDKVFFRTASPLTEDDPNNTGAQVPGGVTTGAASTSSADLFMYDFPDDPEADPGDGDLVRISAGPTGDADGNVSNLPPGGSGAVRFASDDGSRLYFTSAAPLPGVPLAASGTITTPEGTRSTSDATNLYLYDANVADVSERWRFVARLPRSSTLGDCATSDSSRGANLVRVAPSPALTLSSANCVKGTSDGTFVTFWTDGRLTLDDADATTGDFYAYDATGDELTRITEPQGGAGGSYPCTPGSVSAQCHGDGGFGSYELQTLGVATDPLTPGDRMAFFQSRSRLVPEDTDLAYDVYQWRNGELSLITVGGSDPDGFFYRGNDRSGRSVFFSTLDRMTWQDRDAVVDVYVARVGGGIPQPPGPVGCDLPGGGCHGVDAAKAPLGIDPSTSGREIRSRRVQLDIAGVSKKARASAARTGRLALKVTVSGPTRISAAAKARLSGKSRTVARASESAPKAGTLTLRLRLSWVAAKRRLASGKALRLTVVVSADGARTETARVTLKRAHGAKRRGGR
jgi:hypothetical protein